MNGKSKQIVTQAIIAFLVMGVAAFVAIDQLTPPDALPASTAYNQFSAERAIQHIKAIAQAPRQVGQPGFKTARDYVLGELIGQGLNPEIQKTSVTLPEDLRLNLGPGVETTQDVENILARMDGAGSKDAILLVSHLDSTGGPGASDNASGVAIWLETARALLASPSLRNTLIFLFTAPEETGTHGAVAFIQQHPWVKDVRLVINLDAGGLSGPSELTNTSPDNGWLIRELAAADPYAFGSSSSGTGSSDFNPFKFYGFSGYAFDFSRDLRRHTSSDNVDNLNPASIQHQGYHALYLTRYLGNLASLQDLKLPSPVYFNILRSGLVYYPTAWVLPILLIVTLVFAGVVLLGFRRKCLSYSGIGWGALVLAVSLVTAPVLIRLLWVVLASTVPKYQVTNMGHAINEPLLFAVFASLTIALTTTWYVLIRKARKVSLPDLTTGALVLVWIATVFTSITKPGASYTFTWPLLFSLLAIGYWFYSLKEDMDSFSVAQFSGLLVAAVVTIVLILPGVYFGFTGSETNNLFEPVFSLVLMLGLLVPQLYIVTRPQKWWLPVAAGLSAMVLAGIAILG